jgi:hypothetical protein
MNRKAGIALLVVVLSAVAFWMTRTAYYVEASATWQIVCNTGDCYLFIAQSRSGWETTRIGKVWGAIRGALGGAYPPTKLQGETKIVRVSPRGVSQQTFTASVLPLEAYKGRLYVTVTNAPKPCICEWTGDGLRELTTQEAETLRLAEQAGLTVDFLSQGWRRFYFEGRNDLTVQMEGSALTFSLSGDPQTTRAISVRGAGNPDERVLWSLEHGPHRVDEGAYRELFKRVEWQPTK